MRQLKTKKAILAQTWITPEEHLRLSRTMRWTPFSWDKETGLYKKQFQQSMSREEELEMEAQEDLRIMTERNK